MLRSFLRLLSSTPEKPSLIETDSKRVVLYARVDETAKPERRSSSVEKRSVVHSARANHRERLLAMRLEYTKLCSPRRCERFRQMGIVTAGDLSNANPDRLAIRFGAPRKALRLIKQYRRAIRFAAAVPGMMPRDALLLISIHRRSARGLALESPSALHRDLERFAESTSGRLQLRGRRVPSTRRLRRWISECESSALKSPVQARVA